MFSLHAVADSITASLRPQASVDAERVRLADLAELHCTLPAECARLGEMAVGSAPRVGESRMVTRARLVAALRHAGYANAAQIEWAGAEAIAITTASQLVPAAQLEQAALAVLRQAYGKDQLDLTLTDVPAKVAVPNGALQVRGRALLGKLRAVQQVTLDVSVDGRFYRSVQVGVAIQAQRTAFFAKSALTIGAVVGCDQFEQRTVDITRFNTAPVAVDCSAPVRLARALRQGDYLDELAVKPVPAVMQGDRVALNVEQGAVRLQSLAVALADGDIGSVIQLRPVAGTEPVRARVSGKGQVILIGTP
ncbi:flagellar basal body P-ring formation chaperone FlgA [Andreprevotia sp. IGB-42]|uniref:flagellar basal body P-ring formation chaperone FlgA n=1 Tax=Andreprevotia sp. IGB-42 TaxID=2497473 RepID=UPI00135AB68A|nr:flagellar basal body P-ring formation chaperone FlgA [Andreprevotia sp. IGB-42]